MEHCGHGEIILMEDSINWESPIFSFPKSLGERKWGKEEILESSSGKWTMKKLFIKAGSNSVISFALVRSQTDVE